MSASQAFHLSAVLLIGSALAALYFSPFRQKEGLTSIFSLGFACIILGIVGSAARGKDILELVILSETGGFGRAYVGGLGLLVAGFIICFLSMLKKMLRKKGRGD